MKLNLRLREYYSLLAALTIMCLVARAQSPDGSVAAMSGTNQAVDITATGLQIGDAVPNITIKNIHNYTTASAKISDFQGKVLIIDFWATWCSPCVAMLPIMDSLQRAYGDKIQFLSVTYQKGYEALPFLKKLESQHQRDYDIPVATGDDTLRKLFPHKTLPHYVWIDPKGVVQAITDFKSINRATIEQILADNDYRPEAKQDFYLAFDGVKPFLINGNGGDGRNLMYHAVLAGYTNGLGGGYSFSPTGKWPQKITARNQTIINLFRLAHGERKVWYGENRIHVEVKDRDALIRNRDSISYADWKPDHTYCYEIWLTTEGNDPFKLMQRDLENIFPYTASIKKRQKKCWVLVRNSPDDRMKTAGGRPSWKFDSRGFEMINAPLNILIGQLNVQHLKDSPYPVINETGYTGRTDIKVDARLTDMAALNSALQPYGLEFILKEHSIDVLVIRDRT